MVGNKVRYVAFFLGYSRRRLEDLLRCCQGYGVGLGKNDLEGVREQLVDIDLDTESELEIEMEAETDGVGVIEASSVGDATTTGDCDGVGVGEKWTT